MENTTSQSDRSSDITSKLKEGRVVCLILAGIGLVLGSYNYFVVSKITLGEFLIIGGFSAFLLGASFFARSRS